MQFLAPEMFMIICSASEVINIVNTYFFLFLFYQLASDITLYIDVILKKRCCDFNALIFSLLFASLLNMYCSPSTKKVTKSKKYGEVMK